MKRTGIIPGGMMAAGIALAAIGTAQAHWHDDGPSFSIGIAGPPAYYAPPPPPPYYAPPPGYYAPQDYYGPPPGYYPPPPVYYAPPPPAYYAPPAGLSFGITLPLGDHH